jgi:hypothetical protein
MRSTVTDSQFFQTKAWRRLGKYGVMSAGLDTPRGRSAPEEAAANRSRPARMKTGRQRKRVRFMGSLGERVRFAWFFP